ncbi:sensor histidine kinase [Rubrivivax sp. RP6-9]|uniref:sensor histidine kinase n=1 Tax=Rubrivivax sp. RP6-9 TaxID=3415750 RepID=UPI003CC51F5F
MAGRGPWLQRSLHRQLLLWLLLPQLVLWLAAAFVTFNVAQRYANRGIDASLLQATRALARQVKPIGNGLFIDFPRAAQDIIEADPDDRVSYMVSTPPGQFILGNRRLPLPPGATPPRLGEPYFYDAQIDSLRLRVAALYVPIGEAGEPAAAGAAGSRQVMLVQIARSQASRDELARAILMDTVLPLSALIVLMTMIVWAGIRAGLAPLARLRAQVENRVPNDLAPLQPQAAPEEVRALATAVNQLLAAVQDSVAAQRRFVSNAAHQLRTPLAGLKSQAELALGENHDPALTARLQRVHESAVRGAHLVNQLLTLTRAEPEAAGTLPLQRVDLAALAAEVASDHVPRALQAGIDLGVDDVAPGSTPVSVLGNEALLREAVVNLVDNAIRYAGRGAEVTLSVRRDGVMAVLEVADNGPGIAPDQLEAVFGRFYRATHEGSGCGLGLAIVREIATRHGGRAVALPAQPRGLRVQLWLPLQKD